MSEKYQNYMGYLWVQKEDNVYTIGINEEGLEEITEIESVELPQEGLSSINAFFPSPTKYSRVRN